jgi:hypothetical protein
MPAIHLSQMLTTRQRAEYADGWPGDCDPTAVLSSGQRRLWALAQMGGASAAYNEPMAFRLRGSLDRAALASALDALVARHEALRTRVVAVDGVASQRIGPPDSGFALVTQDLTGRPDADAWLADLHRREFQRGVSAGSSAARASIQAVEEAFGHLGQPRRHRCGHLPILPA